MVITQVNFNTFQRGLGYWKFNSALLSEFVTEMSDFITSHFENYKSENPLTAWEMFKVYAKHRCQDYSKKAFQKECNPQRATATATKGNRKSAVCRAMEQGSTQKTLAN